MQELLDRQEYDLRTSFTAQLAARDAEYESITKEFQQTVSLLESQYEEAQLMIENFSTKFENAKSAKEGEIQRLKSALQDCGEVSV